MAVNLFFQVLLCVCISYTHAQGPSTLVQTTQGWIEGTVATDGEYYAYYGIPYAGNTSGVNRFKAAPPAPIFDEVFKATDNSILCIQPGPNGPIGVEDCLTLSVFTKELPRDTANDTNNAVTAKPVLVWLIGEDFTTSDPLQHSFRKLVEEGLVVVALNYRLSVFGFLCLGITDAPGNAGLRDVLQGLQWIQENIEQFGGDPGNVVLFGHGAGGAMTDLLTMSPMARGLIHKAIFHSGSALSPWALAYDPLGSARSLGTKFGYSNSSQRLTEQLQSTSANDLVNTISDFEFLNNEVLFAPCMESFTLDPENRVIPNTPYTLLLTSEFLQIPVIAGYTDKEGTIRVNQAVNGEWLSKMQNNLTDFLPVDLEFRNNMSQIVTDSARELYFENSTISMNTIDQYFDFHGDISITVSVIRSALIRARRSSAEVRLLEVVYRGTNNSDWPFDNIALTGVPHGGFLNYLLDFDLRSIDRPVMERVIERYVTFAYTGKPYENIINWPRVCALPVFCEPWFLRIRNLIADSDTLYGYTEESRLNPHQPYFPFWNNIYDENLRSPIPLTDSGMKTTPVALVVLFSLILSLF